MAESNFFKNLNKLFSTGVVVRNIGGKKLKVLDFDNMQSFSKFATNILYDKYVALYSSNRYGYGGTSFVGSFPYVQSRISLFNDYELMDNDPTISTALDIFADECVTKNEYGDILKIESSDTNIKKILENLFYDILNCNFTLWPWIRNMVKYGDFFLKLDIVQNYGIVNVVPMSVYEIIREENYNPKNPYDVRFIQESPHGKLTYKSYEVAHFRLLSDTNYAPYGKCLAEDNYIDTEYGSKQIKDITIQDKLWTFNIKNNKMELANVLNHINSGKKNIIRIETQHNFIDVSETHPILKFNIDTKKYEYILAKDIKIDDLLVVNSNKNKKNKKIKINKELTGFNKNGWKNDLDIIPEYFNEEFAEFFGFMIGDGWLQKKLHGVSFAGGIDEEQNNYYNTLLEKYSNKKSTYTSGIKNKNGCQYTVYSSLLANILYNNGFLFGAKNKRVPQWVFECDEKIRLAFIKGLTNADGYMHFDGIANRYGIMLCNKNLIFDFKKLIQSLNIKTSNISSKIYNDRVTICGVECNRSEAHSFYYYLDGQKKKQLKKYNVINSDEVLLERVKKISNIGNKITYDIQVDSNNSNFIANGIVIHNSGIEQARKIWKQVTLMEDAMLIHRIMRAPERRIFKIDVGNVAPAEVDSYMEKIINSMKKTPYVDQNTGEYNLRFNLQNMLEDYWLPGRGGKDSTSIDTLPGMTFNGMDDIKYLMGRMLSALRIPNAFLGFEENMEGKATLAALDVRFSRTIERIQQTIISELTKIAAIHLFSQGFTNSKLVDFTLSLTNPSSVAENEKISQWSEKIRIAKDFKDSKLFSTWWVYKNIFGMTEDDMHRERAAVIEDLKQTFRHTQIESEGNDPVVTEQSFGTPHDLAALYLRNKIIPTTGGTPEFGDAEFSQNWNPNPYHSPVKMPQGGWDGAGRPPEGLKYKTDKHPLGRNPIGQKSIEQGMNADRSIKHNFRGNSPLAYESTNISKEIQVALNDLNFIKQKKIISETYSQNEMDKTKKMLVENKTKTAKYLDEKSLLDTDESTENNNERNI